MSFKFIEVCAGCGGLSTGLELAGLSPILLVDNNKDCVNTLKENKPNIDIQLKKMEDLNLEQYKNQVDLLVGGLPCQSFSQAGKRKGLDDSRGQLFLEFCRLLKECEPKSFLIENVQGLITHENGETLNTLLNLLKINGKYQIYYKLLNANDYNVPQKRKRIFIVGVDNTYNHDFKFPVECVIKPVLNDVLTNCPSSEGVLYSQSKREVLELVPPGGCWIDLPKDIQKSYMGNSYTSGGGKRGIARRLSMNEPSLTLTTSPCQKQTERCHPIETRPLQLREYARIQTFPDNFVFKGSILSQYKQIGNAVPVNLAYYIGKSIIEFLSS